ncbi:MAG: hypothetical protein M1833_002889 [Piccolia ochrophora]|nr:MAG: hypothetical protein M1833_002889 [Piccolia ochrophora]
MRRFKAAEIGVLRQQIQTYFDVMQMATQTMTVIERVEFSVGHHNTVPEYQPESQDDKKILEYVEECSQSIRRFATSASTVIGSGQTILNGDDNGTGISVNGGLDLTSKQHIGAWARQTEAASSRPVDNVQSLQTPSSPSERAPSIFSQDTRVTTTEQDSQPGGGPDFVDAGLVLNARFLQRLYKRAQKKFEAGQYEEAEKCLKMVLDRSEGISSGVDLCEVHKRLREAYLQQEKWDEADNELAAFPDSANSVVEELFLRATEAYDCGDNSASSNMLEQVLRWSNRIAPQMIRDTHFRAGLAYYKQDKLQESKLHFRQILTADEDIPNMRSFEARHHLALICMEEQDLVSAHDHCRHAAKGRERVLSKWHPSYHGSVALLVEILRAQGGFLETELLQEDLDDIRKVVRPNLQIRISKLTFPKCDARKKALAISMNRRPSYLSTEAGRVPAILSSSTVDTPGGVPSSATADVAETEHDPSGSTVADKASSNGLEPVTSDRSPESELISAATDGSIYRVMVLLEGRSFELNATNEHGATALAMAAKNGHDRVILRLLIEKGLDLHHHKTLPSRPADVYSKASRLDLPPLHIALSESRDETLEVLLEADGINVNAMDEASRTALHYAAVLGTVNSSSVKLLLSSPDIQCNATCVTGETRLCLVVRCNNLNFIKKLLSHTAVDVNSVNKSSSALPPLHKAVAWCNIESLKLLLVHPQIGVNNKSNLGETAVHLAAKEGYISMVEALLEHPKILSEVENSDRVTPK